MTDISMDTAVANLTHALAATLANRFSRIVNVVDDFGAAGNGFANDTDSVQIAINSSAGKAILLFPKGCIFNVSGLTIPSNSHLLIEGTIFLINNSNGPVITLLGSNYLIEGSGIIDGNQDNNEYGGLGAAGIMTNTGGTEPPNLSFSNIIIKNITIQNIKNWPVSINSSSNVLIDGTTLKNSGSAPQAAYGSQYIRFVNNLVINIPDYGWAFYQGCSYGVCSNNIFNNVAAVGILNDGTVSGGWNGQPQHDIIISNNVMNFTGALGSLNVTGYESANFYNINFYGNRIIDSGTNGGFTCGILLENTSNSVVESNVVRGGGSSGSVWQGIAANGGVINCVIRNNTISNGGQNGASAAYGISAGFVNCIVSNNHFYDDQETPTLEAAYAGTLEPSASYSWNTYIGLKSGVFTFPLTRQTNFIGQYSLGSNEIIANSPLILAYNVTYISSGFNSIGLTVGWNRNSSGDVNLFLGNGGMTGGLYAFQVDSSGNIVPGSYDGGAIFGSDNLGNFKASSYCVGSTNGPTWTTGDGPPTSSQPVGSLYSNVSGSVGSILYVSAGTGEWHAVSGV